VEVTTTLRLLPLSRCGAVKMSTRSLQMIQGLNLLLLGFIGFKIFKFGVIFSLAELILPWETFKHANSLNSVHK
jgi:hypothetical protein